MYSFKYSLMDPSVKFEPLSGDRQWQDELPDNHAYRCFPLTLANRYGWGISFPEDISFIWNGIKSASKDNVKALSGGEWIYFDRGWGTVSFKTGLFFETDKDVTMLGYPVPNSFINDFQIFTYLISTSFYRPWQLAGQITEPNKVITIKAGTPVGAVMPVSLAQIDNSEAVRVSTDQMQIDFKYMSEYSKEVSKKNKQGEWTNFYRNATNHFEEKIGEHEVKSIKIRNV